MNKPPIFINNYTLCNALGSTKAEILENLENNRCLLQLETQISTDTTYVGKIPLSLPELPAEFSEYYCRNNQVVLWCLQQLENDITKFIEKYGRDRIAVVMGTSTAGIDLGEQAIKSAHADLSYHYRCQELGSISGFVARYLGLNAPHFTISTACSSSARVFISAQRLLQSGLVDAVLVGGVDTLCHLTLNGFNSLASLSEQLTRPFADNRAGINIGEAGAMFLLSREESDIVLAGVGESSDAHHISAPEPNGAGAERAMRDALHNANLSINEIGYLNLHGTATPLNDSMESLAVNRVFGQIPCSSTKHLTGHTLGAAGATELAISCLLLEHYSTTTKPLLPRQTDENKQNYYDHNLPEIGVIFTPAYLEKPVIMSNSFAFGGNNSTLIIKKRGG
ncbi:beta-ketoacyl-[acyl-carrier-protein] synthase family protein [Gallibacterium salpingitidis]|uniref:beta-ketoacyl-[acyl-carrier-protein] synthase family protein n=1 Tax=Gallibacterium salpingitidis TaxID=505341 RepID=UPI0026708CE3|nr:beta-ketoacyl-[acyl-carrier-protein] synthase family protein [Gallibacterium salpingitidis]WKS99395.1 beta-ketoacyl-[acyl-carrier-protein] synthase family protein [Gallibacterium salpingitidis]